MEEQEIWKVVDGFPNYEISNFGRIRSKKHGIMKPQKTVSGYLSITLYARQKFAPTLVKSARIHRLVLHAFNPTDNEDKMQVNHIDHDRTNNKLSNLEWTTASQNCNRKAHKEKYYNSIGCYDEYGNYFNSYKEAARYYDISPNTVKNDVLGKKPKYNIYRMTFHK